MNEKLKKVLVKDAPSTVVAIDMAWRSLKHHRPRTAKLTFEEHGERIKGYLGVIHKLSFYPKYVSGNVRIDSAVMKKFQVRLEKRRQQYYSLSLHERQQCFIAAKKALAACHRLNHEEEICGLYDTVYKYISFIEGAKYAYPAYHERLLRGNPGISNLTNFYALESLIQLRNDDLSKWATLGSGVRSRIPAFEPPLSSETSNFGNMKIFDAIYAIAERMGTENLNLRCYNVILSIYSFIDAPFSSSEMVYKNLRKLGIKPNLETCKTIVQHAVNRGAWKKAIHLALNAQISQGSKFHLLYPVLLKALFAASSTEPIAVKEIRMLDSHIPEEKKSRQLLVALVLYYIQQGFEKDARRNFALLIDYMTQSKPLSLMPYQSISPCSDLLKWFSSLPYPENANFTSMFITGTTTKFRNKKERLLTDLIITETIAKMVELITTAGIDVSEEDQILEGLRQVAKRIHKHCLADDMSASIGRNVCNNLIIVHGANGEIAMADKIFQSLPTTFGRNILSFRNRIWVKGVVEKDRLGAMRLVGELQSAGLKPDQKIMDVIADTYIATSGKASPEDFYECIVEAHISALRYLEDIMPYWSTIAKIRWEVRKQGFIMPPEVKRQIKELREALPH